MGTFEIECCSGSCGRCGAVVEVAVVERCAKAAMACVRFARRLQSHEDDVVVDDIAGEMVFAIVWLQLWWWQLQVAGDVHLRP